MILRPIIAGVTDHGELNGLGDDDHVDYLRLDTARGLSQSVKLYVAANAYFIQEGNTLVLYVNDQEETRWP